MGYQHVHLFAGIGAFALGMRWAGYPSSIRTFTGGFPCQDVSNAGKRAGIEGEHSGLWKEMCRLIQEAMDSGMGPDIIILENVSALIHRGLSTVLGDLAEIGMDARWFCLRASDVGAPHQRERIFIVAHSESREDRRVLEPGLSANLSVESPDVADARSTGRQECNVSAIAGRQGHIAGLNVEDPTGGRKRQHQATRGEKGTQSLNLQSSPRQLEPGVGRNAARFSSGLHGHQWPAGPGESQHEWEPPRTVVGKQPDRAKRLKALGNAIVPQCVQYVVEHILANMGK